MTDELGSTRVLAGLLRNERTGTQAPFYMCPACKTLLALVIPPDSGPMEHLSDMWSERVAVFIREDSRMAGVPVCDVTVDHVPDCRSCGWRPTDHDTEA